MKTQVESNPGLRLSPRGKRVWLIIIIVSLLIAVALALTDTADAATLAGNGGGCAAGNRWRGLACTVSDSGNGWVSGVCDFGLSFGPTNSARTFVPGKPIIVQGCEGMDGELFSARGWPLRISR